MGKTGSQTLNPLLQEIHEWLRKKDEPDRVFTKNKKVEIVFLVEAVNAILPRTEGVEDITLLKLPGTEYEVPVILPEKLQAVTRRRMLAYLRRFRDMEPEKMKDYLEQLSEIGTVQVKGSKSATIVFIKARQFKDRPTNWNCYIQPPGGDSPNATDIGVDGFCPACMLFGTVITDKVFGIIKAEKGKESNMFSESVGVKSRVEFDPAFAFLDQEMTVVSYTHNKVADGVSWTGKGLYEEKHVVPGTVFVGKVTLEDVTEAELAAFLTTLATITRLGGRERVFGGVKVHIIGIKGGSYETVSALELARELAKKYTNTNILPDVEEVKNHLRDILKSKGFIDVTETDFKGIADNPELWASLWDSTVEYSKQVALRIAGLAKGEEKVTRA